MNPSDEEDVKDDEVVEEAEATALPQVIEEERVVRHAEKNDSYREAPDLEEEIIQPPLDPPEEVEVRVDPSKEDDIQIKKDTPVIGGVIPDDIPVISEEIAPLARMSQHDIEPEIEPEGVSYEKTTTEETSPSPEVAPQTVQEIITEQVVKTSQALPQTTSSAEPVVYHTISGGPETLNDAISHHKNIDQAVSGQPPTTYTNAATGYTIPNPNYVPPTVPVPAPQSYFGIIFFFGFILMVGGALGYVYFVMPETFNQFISAVVVVKDQILKK
jgi:hypothetical protein